MPRFVNPVLALVASVAALLLASGCVSPQGSDPSAISLKSMGSFHIGGREVELKGKPVKDVLFTRGGVPAKVDPNGVYQVEQMYVQYFIPTKQRAQLPLLMWHGGGLTGVTYESTPDGREGWLNYFLRQGWSVYNSDAMERGRSGWAPFPDIFETEPVFLTKNNPFERFRIGSGAGSYSKDPSQMKLLPGSQFPPEGYDNFTKQNVPRWTSTDEPIVAAYVALVDKVCPCVVLAHSQGGPFAMRVAQARPDKVKGLVLVEPAGVGVAGQEAALRATPTLVVYGDYIEQDARWPTIRRNTEGFLAKVSAASGQVDYLDLPKQSIRGNSHMLMMDRNSDQIAGLIQQWLASRGFVR
jgi:Alpha/beta hydrolase family